MQALELAVQLATAIAKAYPVVKADITQVGKDTGEAQKLRDALKTAKDALDALSEAIDA